MILLGVEDEGENAVFKYSSKHIPGRYVLSFTDRHEARRFVREWHKRPCPLQPQYKLGDEPPPLANAEIVW